jgi:predicted esterase
MIGRHRAFYAAVVAGVAIVAVIAVVRGRRERPTALGDPEAADWCAAGYAPIAGGGCFAAPDPIPPRAPLVVYLHGMYPPRAAEEEAERQSRLARLAALRGFAVLALRGKQNQCVAETVRDYWCWPSNERNANDGPAFVASFRPALANAEALVPGGPAQRWLVGFSNGGYFAGIIALRSLLPFDAVAIAHAGPTEPVMARPIMPPILLVTADEDLAIPSMMRFDTLLSSVKWPHAIVTRDGGHDLTEHDIGMALTFFDRVRREGLPLRPPLSTRKPRPNLPDAGATDAASATSPEPIARDAVDASDVDDHVETDADTAPPFSDERP